MRFLSADYIFPLHEEPIKNGVLQINKNGTVISLFKNRKDINPDKLEIFSGILCPGFINAHCHLELSHLKDFVKQGEGLIRFITQVRKRNKFSKSVIYKSIANAESKMIKEGIVAVGDICNTTDTLLQKKQNKLLYYNFIEVFQIKEENIEKAIRESQNIQKSFKEEGLISTIVPHSLYSVLPSLMLEISKSITKDDMAITFHNQESEIENKLFKEKSGEMFNWLKNIDANPKIWNENINFSTISLLNKAESKKNIVLVHNTFTNKKDIQQYKKIFDTVYWCTCPKSNNYIEGKLPNYALFDVTKLCVGTDSLASNNSLSILEELKIIGKNSNFNLNNLLTIACKNGAEALGFNHLGTFEKQKNPGVNLIQKLNNKTLHDQSTVRKII